MRWLSRLVTIALIVLVVLGAAALVRSRMPATRIGQDFTTCAQFRDGTRLAVGSPVLIAGVRVGEISHLTLVGNFARVDMRLRNATDIPVDSWVTKRAFSPFGDSYLEIIPSTPDPGAAPVRTLQPGECIARVIEGASTDSVLRGMAQIQPQIENGLDSLHDVGLEGRRWASGSLEDSVVGMQHWLDEGHIEKPIENANAAMARLEASTTRAANALTDAQPDIDGALDRVASGVAKARARITEMKGDVHNAMEGVRSGLDGADQTLADTQELLAAINEGRGDDYKGKLGRLINDPQLADDIEEGTESGMEAVSSFGRFKSYLGLRTELDVFTRAPRFFVTAEVRARTDKFYYIELEKGPLGGYPQVELDSQTGVPTYTKHAEIHDTIRFTVQFGKQLGDHFQVRGGIKESTFGFGADVLMGEGRLKFSSDLYGGLSRIPRLKLAAAFQVFRSVYVVGGIDDALSTPGYLPIKQGSTRVPTQFEEVRFGRDYFFGASLNFDEADLAMLLRVYGALLVGLL